MNIENKIKEILTLNNNTNIKIMELLTYINNSSMDIKALNTSIDNNFNILDMVKSNMWPAAVNENLIIDRNNEEEKQERAQVIIELFLEESLENKKFLDYGCGEGHVVEAASKLSTYAVGYDIKSFSKWNEINCISDWNKIVENGPYDVILLFDVLDHLINESPIEALNKIKSITSKNGSVYVRFHPITSRCATHSYHKLNKAFVHLVLNHDQLMQLLPNEEDYIPNNGSSRPLKSYEEYIRESGFIIESRNEITEKPEEFFKNPNIANIIQNKTGFNEFPEFQMSLNFVDYKLVNK